MSRVPRRRPHRASRRGFTLAELMIAIVLFGMVMAALIQVLARQQRFHRGASAVVEMRGQMRHAAYALPVDLRPVSPAGGDIIDWSSSSIAFRSFSGASVTCDRLSASEIMLAPTSLTQGNTLSAWIRQPEPGDSILIHDENILVGNADDVWRAHEIVAVKPVSGGCGTATGFTVAADGTARALQLTLSPNLSPTVVDGAPVRIFRHVRYELYKAGDGKFYLGISDCLPGRAPECSELTPVSGPFRELNEDPALSGLQLLYYDVDDKQLDPAVDDPATIARIEIVVRAETSTPFSTTQATGGYSDSLSFVVGLRNR